jgi:DNA topoisomerase-1
VADSESSEDEKPLARGRKPAAAAAKPASRRASTKAKPEPESSSEDEKPLAKRGRAAPAKKTDKKPAVKKEKKGAEEEDDDKYKWWEQDENNDGSVKWTTFHHQGVLFPPPYEPLPKNVKMKYDGKVLTLPPESEEVAGFFAAMIETDHAQDAKFRENFFRDFKATLAKYPPVSVTCSSQLT